ncbi:MAG: hypothetical protein RL685_1391 [Pseudomonadota bacterium]|jgi:hypothetical protein
MKHSDILETITEQPLSDAELSQVHGGYPAGPGPHPPAGPTGKPLGSFDDLRIPPGKLPVFHKPLPGEQTPPIIVLPTA